MSKGFEGREVESKEEQEYISRILLRFLRHGERERPVGKDDVDDKAIGLTEKGKKETRELFGTDTNPEQAVGYSSGRKRTDETALLSMMGEQSELSNDDLVELYIEREEHSAQKVHADNRLDIQEERGGEADKLLLEANETKGFVKQMTEWHDDEELSKKYNSYDVRARGIASLIQRYVHASDRWNDLVTKDNSQYEDTLERYFATHGGVQECFLAEIIDRMQGRAERDQFIDKYKKGFGELEGLELTISKIEDIDEPTIRIFFRSTDVNENPYEIDMEVPKAMIQEIARGKEND